MNIISTKTSNERKKKREREKQMAGNPPRPPYVPVQYGDHTYHIYFTTTLLHSLVTCRWNRRTHTLTRIMIHFLTTHLPKTVLINPRNWFGSTWFWGVWFSITECRQCLTTWALGWHHTPKTSGSEPVSCGFGI